MRNLYINFYNQRPLQAFAYSRLRVVEESDEFGYTIATYSDFYDFRNLLVLGRVLTGEGGDLILSTAQEVLRAEFPEMHVYHYAPYEPGALKRLMGRYATRQTELDNLLRSKAMVDLYAVVRNAIRASGKNSRSPLAQRDRSGTALR